LPTVFMGLDIQTLMIPRCDKVPVTVHRKRHLH